MVRVADRLATARRHHFVGRVAERALFRSVLSAAELPFLVLYVHGPGGVGKTALLREFATLAQEAGAAVCYLDARNLDPAPEPFLHALRLALDLAAEETPAGAWATPT